jgi:HD-GYP domain-containing protein (c-di-GMP phosphodiesterase class II)
MKLMSVNDLEPGMVIAKPVYNENLQLLVNRDVALQKGLIERIQRLDYDRVWIKDDNDTVTDYLSEELKIRAVRAVKSIFTGYSSKKLDFNSKEVNEVKTVIENVVDEILSNKNCVVQLSNIRNFNNNMYEHAVDVSRISVLIGVNMGLNKDKLCDLCQAAMLHDIGKIKFPVGLLSKETPYTKAEIEELTKHVTFGQELIKRLNSFNSTVTTSILQHHENYNGSGYPNGKSGNQIFVFARIIRVADVYSTLRTGTPNTKSLSQASVLEYFYGDAGNNFDPEISKIFLEKVPVYEVGQIIRLSTGQKAFVIENNKNALSRPIIRLLSEDNKNAGKEIDLSKDLNITIVM